MRNTYFMGKLHAIILFFAISALSLTAQNLPYETVTQNGQTFYKYSVKSGEGLYAISRTFSVSVADILRHNPGANTGLQNGQQLLIPVNESNAPASSASVGTQQTVAPPVDQNRTFQHKVSVGETLYAIAHMYNTSVDEIKRFNSGLTDAIQVGQVLTIPQRRTISAVKEENYRYHTILPKETLYSVSRTYSLRPEDVITANPGLSVETFQIGKTIRIPFFESNEVFTPFHNQTVNVQHTVKRGETLYSIAKQYDVSVEDIQNTNPILSAGLKTNMELFIPVRRSSLEGDTRAAEREANRLLSQTIQSPNVDVMKVGLLLPFLDEAGRGHLRLQEYYEGFALAVEKMKNEGANIELYVFEIGRGNDTKKLESLLGTLEMQSLNLLVGGVNDAQIKVMSDFSKAYNVKYVVPFSLSNSEVLNNGNIFQVNPPNSSTFLKASQAFIQTFRNANVVFVSGGRNDKTEFVSKLQSELRASNISYETISLTSTLNTAILSLLSTTKENVIVPTTGDSNTLKEVIEHLKKVKETNSAYVTRLFGYPEWQTYGASMIKEYHNFGTYIYTPFFTENKELELKMFHENFRKWYGRNLMETTPSYGLWGYETGVYFMNALRRFGANFQQNINQVRVQPVQFAFNFERVNNWGGFINTGLYLVHYDTNGLVIKQDKSR